MSLLPKEHGAYGQVSFPIATALSVAGISAAGLLITAATIAGFLAHEPASIVLGLRGQRARRELWRPALQWLGCCAAIGVATGIGALLSIDPASRWSITVPLVPALLLAVLTCRGEEKSSSGEIAAALAFSGAAVPVAMAAGAPLSTAVSVAIPFALLFVASTLAVRVVILRVRGGGDRRAAAATRLAALFLAGGAAVALGLAIEAGYVPMFVLLAAAPGLLTAAIVAAHPPAPTHLRPLGWTLVFVSVLTSATLIVSA